MQVAADVFCHSMVRSLAGELIPVGEHRKTIDYPRQALERRAREVGVTARPAHTLVLEEVSYPPESEWVSRQRETQAVRAL
jgi:tRNA pseudouridine38-40 synthase